MNEWLLLTRASREVREVDCRLPCGSFGLKWMSHPMVSDKNARQREDVYFRMLRLIEERPDASQREIAEKLGVSLGAVNYCLRALLGKGYLKLTNLKASKNKFSYVYVLTPEGIAHRAGLAVRFVERKVAEYHAIQAELKQLREDFVTVPVLGDE